MNDLCTVILAAGQGTRMRSKLPKVVHPVAGLPMITYVVEACRSLQAKRTLVITGHQADRVREAMAGEVTEFVHQPEQHGTAHALLQAHEALAGFDGDLLVVSGDTPLLTSQTLDGLLRAHREARALATVLTAEVAEPIGYGRIIRSTTGELLRIVEELEATPQERKVHEINAGVYCFAARALFEALQAIRPSAVKGELYLPDAIALLRDRDGGVQAYRALDPDEVRGVNTRAELAEIYRLLWRKTALRLLAEGVTFLDPERTYVGPFVRIGPDSILYPNVTLEGQTVIGEATTIYSGCRIRNSTIGNDTVILDGCIIQESQIGDECQVGPYAHLRPHAQLRQRAKVGNFVEVKKSVVGEGSKVPHLSYIGDTTIGERVNVGAGTITCNYDGFTKHQTVIEDDVFVGSDVILVAPVSVGRGAIIAAGSTITENVPPDALAFGRARQVNKSGSAGAFRSKHRKG
ncbi:MAG: bifunctional UDP-N-acetylglucosamine diphosphorylase/glucosamine-1-phosphate N-acetyltransferase GlmU [Candidatus Methylomirabilis oxygeniifera]|uniref:Bifunctional protein GlmU n=1 Tax=Methylomirabilis oxygeniifera TaxID=671143 RepID=D5MH09_METO1|nr:MAG: bifunctional UDP-N-acetylglucosamine diphosphorylase/glucosamine-1-phosphate N-acetyltransferase GlmU [Candidatus Methylomirabilis oxyfera]CBE69040.1 bifunctional: N-acetyl glucosamine-1-phosphate uridyltransferase (N-terminal); glucosamine-1-phosphate acetyl transferase (C-terminal) [Candidatus Methylomirabilis oxyfera]